jgi:adenylate cyclase
VIEQLVRHPSELRLGGRRETLTIFFSDLAGFTTFSERMEPEELVRTLNRYLGDMTAIILARQGTLDKYIGDAIMAFWGAPVPLPDHARLACLAALGNQARLGEIGPELAPAGGSPLVARIGLNTGPAVVGNLGSETTFDYTVMGDTVNLASRLEGLNKEYGTRIMASDATRQAAGPGLLWRELDLVRVKGKETAVRIHELLCLEDTASPVERETAALQDEALALYRAGGFAAAATAWRRVLAARPGDGPARVMIARCEAYQRQPPHADWRGEHVMQHK